MDTWLREL